MKKWPSYDILASDVNAHRVEELRFLKNFQCQRNKPVELQWTALESKKKKPHKEQKNSKNS